MATGLRAGQQREETRIRQQMIVSQDGVKKMLPLNKYLDNVSVRTYVCWWISLFAVTGPIPSITHPAASIVHQCSEQAFDDFFEIHKTVLNILQLGALKVIAIYLARMQTTYAICYKPKSQQVLQILLICTSPHRPTHSIISLLSRHCFNPSLQILTCWRENLFLLWPLQVALQFPDQLLYAATRVVAKLKVYANFLLLLACLNVQCANCPFKFFATIVLWATS